MMRIVTPLSESVERGYEVIMISFNKGQRESGFGSKVRPHNSCVISQATHKKNSLYGLCHYSRSTRSYLGVSGRVVARHKA